MSLEAVCGRRGRRGHCYRTVPPVFGNGRPGVGPTSSQQLFFKLNLGTNTPCRTWDTHHPEVPDIKAILLVLRQCLLCSQCTRQWCFDGPRALDLLPVVLRVILEAP